MSSNWEKIGEDIRKTVQDAIENQNYDKLNQMITDKMNQAVDAVSKSVKNAANATQTKYRGYKTYTTDFEHVWKSGDDHQKNTGMKYTNVKNEVNSVPVNTFVKVPSKTGTLVTSALGFVLGGSQLAEIDDNGTIHGIFVNVRHRGIQNSATGSSFQIIKTNLQYFTEVFLDALFIGFLVADRIPRFTQCIDGGEGYLLRVISFLQCIRVSL